MLTDAIIIKISQGGIFPGNASLVPKYFGPRYYPVNLRFRGFSPFVGGPAGPRAAGMVKSSEGNRMLGFIVAIALVVIGLVFGQPLKALARLGRARVREGTSAMRAPDGPARVFTTDGGPVGIGNGPRCRLFSRGGAAGALIQKVKNERF